MQALTFGGIEKIDFSNVADPAIINPDDAIVKISLAGICGSDLHVYHGREMGLDNGTVMGHEFTGIIEEAGAAVKRFKKGDRVLSPFTTSCGECFYCRTGLTCRCEKGSLFGWVQHGHGLQGAQANYVRVPMADHTLLPLSNDLNGKKGLLLGDVFSTGFFCADNADITHKSICVVIGCGPVGLMSIVAAKHLGAPVVIAIDTVDARLEQAGNFGALPINAAGSDPKDEVMIRTNGHGADIAMEAVGSDKALLLAMDLLRPGGTISSVGVHTTENFSFSPGQAYDKNLTYKTGRCPAHFYAEKLLREEIPQRFPIEDIITHEFPLNEGPIAYEVFDKKKDYCIKAVLRMD